MVNIVIFEPTEKVVVIIFNVCIVTTIFFSRKSCNDIKVNGLHKGKTNYKDNFYMLQGNQPVYCDMETTKNEGWTLLVTSASNGWKGEEVIVTFSSFFEKKINWSNKIL